MSWYKEAKLIDKDLEPDKSTFVQCMQCQKYRTEDGRWIDTEEMDAEEIEQHKTIPEGRNYDPRNPIGVSHGVCPICEQALYEDIDRRKREKMATSENGDFTIFGYIGKYGEVESQKVPQEYADTWGEKNGLTHLDIFGYDSASDANHTWRCKGNNIQWYGQPDPEKEFAVENHLIRQYGMQDNFRHHYAGVYE